MVEHRGRRTGLPHRTVLEVIGRGEDSLDVASAWGRHSDWYRNLVAHPRARLSTGRLRDVPARVEILEPTAAAEVFRRYARNHPRAAHALGRTLGIPFDDPPALAEKIPVVRFHLERGAAGRRDRDAALP